MNSRILPAIVILLSLVIDQTRGAVCQGVVDCENEYMPQMRQVGHSKSEYCSLVSKLIVCLQKQTCLGETANHKTNSLRTFQNDSSCRNGTRLTSYSSALFLLPLFLLWMFLN